MATPHTYLAPHWTQELQMRPATRLSLGHLPTPIQPWHPPGVPAGVEIWLKRDDCSGIALSGNKVRKLEFLLAEALTQECDIVLTCGGIQSNHCRATAVAARQAGLDSVLFLRTKDTDADPGLAGNLLLDRLVGAKLELITHAQYQERHALMQAYAEGLRAQGRHPYIIPEGGSSPLGAWGYIEATREIAAQTAQQGLHFDDLVFACGSGGTAVGLCLGARLSQLPTRIHAVNVCDDDAYFYDHIDASLQALGAPYQARELIDIIDGYKGLGYAINRPEELSLLHDVARQTGIFLDPVYSGKAFYGLCQELQTHPERFQGKRILFVHTGGLFGLFGKSNELAPLLT